MTLDRDRLLAFEESSPITDVKARDTMLYALGVGLGHDPLDMFQLQFVHERALRALPTMSMVIGQARPWIHRDPAFGVTATGVFHGEQAMTMHRELPPAGQFRADTHVIEIVDKGVQRGAHVISETRLWLVEPEDLVATLKSTLVLRHDGGCGGPTAACEPTASPEPLPQRPADVTVDIPTMPQQALIYRLSGDDHLLHVDPAFARDAGFDRPILHGACTFGMAGFALLRACCNHDPGRLEHMSCRFSAPVFPGDTVRTEVWLDAEHLRFRATVPQRGLVVLSNGSARIRAHTT